MNTSTRVEFGLYDVTARSDSTPTTEQAKAFCNLSKDLLLESVPSQNKYGTLETRQWLMDGSFLFFPEAPRQYFWGFWSAEQSNGNGIFATPPVLNIRFDKNHSSSGLTLHFYSPTDDWASKVKVQWYDANDGLLAVAMFTPDAVERGVNHCTLTVSKAAEVCVTGRKYSDSATVLRREASNLPSNAQGNEVSVPDATLVSPDRAAAVAARVLDYYAQRYEQTFRMVAGDEKLADRLIVESFGGEMVRGAVTKLEFDLTGGFLADAKIVGRKLSNNAAAYAGEEIHAGERSFI